MPVGDNTLRPFTLPVTGASAASLGGIVRSNDNLLRKAYNAHAIDTVAHVQSGLLAARPVAPDVGTTYYTTDVGANAVYLYLAAGWVAIAGSGISIAGSGTAGRLAKWSAPLSLTDSIITEAGTVITVAGTIVATSLTGALIGNASTATSAATLTTARNINGVSFNGSADITVAAAAGTLTGNTLASGVVTSSLTTIGTLVAGAVPASLVTAGTFGTGDYTFPSTLTATTSLTTPLITRAAAIDIRTTTATSLTFGTNSATRLTINLVGRATFTGQILATGADDPVFSVIEAGADARATTTLIAVNAAAGQLRYFQFKSGGVQRWSFGANNTAEGGSDVGSDFRIAAYTDAGTVIDEPVQINRVAAGSITLGSTGNRQVIVAGSGWGAGNASLRLNGLTTGAGAGAGTLTNAPTAGDPNFWLPVSIAGTVRYIPCW